MLFESNYTVYYYVTKVFVTLLSKQTHVQINGGSP